MFSPENTIFIIKKVILVSYENWDVIKIICTSLLILKAEPVSSKSELDISPVCPITYVCISKYICISRLD